MARIPLSKSLIQSTIENVSEKIVFSCHDDNKMKMARKPGNKQKENLVGCTGKGKRLKGNKRRIQGR